MYRAAYTEINENDQALARSREKEALEFTVKLMTDSLLETGTPVQRVTAIHQTAMIWTHFLEDLAMSENELSRELKAGLISVGVFILKHLQAMRLDSSKTFEPVVDATTTILEGLN